MTNNSNNDLPSLTVTVRGLPITFTSAFPTLADAFRALDAQQGKGSFAVDLLVAARARTLSPKQAAWIHKLATDALTRKDAKRTVDGLRLGAVITMMDNAAEKQKRAPKITLRDKHGNMVKLHRTGEKSRVPGSIFVGDGVYGGAGYAMIGRDGLVRPLAAWTAAIEELLRSLAVSPTSVAMDHGRTMGICCFCSRDLTDPKSIAVGYGPICADKFGLPWGEVDEREDDICERHNTPLVEGDCERCEVEEDERTERCAEEAGENQNYYGRNDH